MTNIKKLLSTVTAIILSAAMLAGCGADENHENTTATHTPEATSPTSTQNNKDDNSVRDDAGNIMDDAGDAVDNAGKAVGDTMKDVGDSMKN